MVLYSTRRRWRSEAAALALIGAFDFGLRAFIDGFRAELNVTWAAHSSLGGIDDFRVGLAVAALVLTGFAVHWERRARMAPPAIQSRQAPPGWIEAAALYAALWLVAWLTDAAQTPFLHVLLMVALVAALPVLPWPREVATDLGQLALAYSRVAAVVLIAPLVVALLLATADPEDGATIDGRTWIYEIVPERAATVRIGSRLDTPDRLAAQRERLDRPEAEEPPPNPRRRSVRLYLGAEGATGTAKYTRDSSCAGDSETDRRNKRVGHCEGGIGPFSSRTLASLPRRSAPYRERLKL